MSTTPVADYGPSAPAPAVTNADASSATRTPPPWEEGLICPSCCQRGNDFVKLHESCLFMVFDVSCLGRAEGPHPFERAAIAAYAKACAKQQPEVARLIRVQLRTNLGRALRVCNRGGRVFVTNKSKPEVRTDPKIVCGHVLTHVTEVGDKSFDRACNLLRGHTDQHGFGDFNAEGKFEIHALWGLTAAARAARLKWSRGEKAFKADAAKKGTTKKAAKATKKAPKGKRSGR